MYQITRLQSGLTLASFEMPHMTSVSVGIWVKVGSRYEPLERNGACHFIEHMLFKGTTNRSAKEISEEIEGTGGCLNAFTSEELTCFHARTDHRRLEQTLDVLLDMLLNSNFHQDDIDKEREVIKEEISMTLDDPQQLVQELLNKTLWPKQPLGRAITGTAGTLKKLNRPELLEWMDRNYLSSNIAIVAAGNVSHADLCRFVKPHEKRIRQGPSPSCIPVLERQKKPKLSRLERDVEQTQIALGFRSCSRHDPRRLPLRILNAVLGENMSSRLFQIIREDKALAYSVYSQPSYFNDTGDLEISMGLDLEKVPEALNLAVAELHRLCEEPITVKELRMAKDYSIGQMDLASESTETQMNWIGENLLAYGHCNLLGTIRESLGQVTQGEIQSVARDFFKPERMNLAIVSEVGKVPSVWQPLQFLR
ncbi:MAG: pitrilysin family protein [Verrucomicrobia bacterium]|nr:pitrilysin family protein [Verrucomicrobiota bacterium]